jgi:NADPH-dependent 2,4-dienoyl-CoA reductase/sulfur reductase-like enzyme
MSAPRGLVVVGASIAGVRTVEALRRRGYDAPITVLGAEPHLPYDRPPLSKEFLLGKLGAADITLTDPQAFADLDIDLRLATRATGLDVTGRCVHVGSERLPYETLVIATGSTPRRLPATDRVAGVHALRTLDDAEAIRTAFAAGARVAVVGGGFVGAEVASSARQLGLDVTIVDPLPALMIRGLGAHVGRVLAGRHADSGVRLRLGRGVAEIRGGARVERLVLDDGSTVDADVVVVGIGVRPQVDWLAGTGLDLADGVACDATLRVADSVYAVGDVARWWTECRGRRLEHWTNAVDQAAALAGVLTGSGAGYDPLPYVWSDQLGTRLQIWGELEPGDELAYISGDEDADEFVVAAGRDGHLVGVVAFGARRDAMRAMRQLRAGASWEPGNGPGEPST